MCQGVRVWQLGRVAACDKASLRGCPTFPLLGHTAIVYNCCSCVAVTAYQTDGTLPT